MKTSLLFLTFILFFNYPAHSDDFSNENSSGKKKDKDHKFKRKIKRGVDKIKKEACLKGKVKCLTIKDGPDKTKEVINKID